METGTKDAGRPSTTPGWPSARMRRQPRGRRAGATGARLARTRHETRRIQAHRRAPQARRWRKPTPGREHKQGETGQNAPTGKVRTRAKRITGRPSAQVPHGRSPWSLAWLRSFLARQNARNRNGVVRRLRGKKICPLGNGPRTRGRAGTRSRERARGICPASIESRTCSDWIRPDSKPSRPLCRRERIQAAEALAPRVPAAHSAASGPRGVLT
jgi:hypothetical protein